MADDVDRMILQMSADLRRMERSFERGQQKANQTAGRIEGRFNRMNRNLARSGDQLAPWLRQKPFRTCHAGRTRRRSSCRSCAM